MKKKLKLLGDLSDSYRIYLTLSFISIIMILFLLFFVFVYRSLIGFSIAFIIAMLSSVSGLILSIISKVYDFRSRKKKVEK